MDNLIKKFAFAVQSAKTTPEESKQFFDSLPSEESQRIWGETQLFDDSPTNRPRILINHDKFARDETVGEDYARELEFGEGLHLLKYIDSETFNDLYDAAMSEPEPRAWLEESYARAKKSEEEGGYGEKRPFKDFVRYSRLDQMIGGYISGNKKSNLPTMRKWDKNLPYGKEFREKLENLEKNLGITNGKNPWFSLQN